MFDFMEVLEKSWQRQFCLAGTHVQDFCAASKIGNMVFRKLETAWSPMPPDGWRRRWHRTAGPLRPRPPQRETLRPPVCCCPASCNRKRRGAKRLGGEALV